MIQDPVWASDGEVAFYQRQASRRKTFVHASLRLVGTDGSVMARGRAIVSDLSAGGVCLSRVRFHEGHLPLHPHHVFIEPSASDLSTIRIKARPVHIRFLNDGPAIGATIVEASPGFDRLFDVPIPTAEVFKEF